MKEREFKLAGIEKETKKYIVKKIVTASSIREAAQVGETAGRIVAIDELNKDFDDYDD